ncbi:MAG: hypothetical protein AABY53_07710 [Bdellovibrionota bacterium]
MKLILFNIFVFFSAQSVQALPTYGAWPGAFDKLQKMYEASGAPSSIDALLVEISKTKGCAGSYQNSPNLILNWALPVKVIYSSPDFGPDFPPEVITGIAMDSTTRISNSVPASFFASYRAVLSSQSLEVKTLEYYKGETCETVDGVYDCYPDTVSSDIQINIRQNEKYIQIKTDNAYVYCW